MKIREALRARRSGVGLRLVATKAPAAPQDGAAPTGRRGGGRASHINGRRMATPDEYRATPGLSPGLCATANAPIRSR